MLKATQQLSVAHFPLFREKITWIGYSADVSRAVTGCYIETVLHYEPKLPLAASKHLSLHSMQIGKAKDFICKCCWVVWDETLEPWCNWLKKKETVMKLQNNFSSFSQTHPKRSNRLNIIGFFNTDEIGLFWQSLLNSSLEGASESSAWGLEKRKKSWLLLYVRIF